MHEITIENLTADNMSDEAKQAREGWRTIRDAKESIATVDCADARLIKPSTGVIQIRSVATGGDWTPYSKLFDDPKIRAIVVGSHFAMSKEANPTEKIIVPDGCGGLAVARDLLNGEVQNHGNGAARYVRKYVKHHDVIRCACDAAAAISEKMGNSEKLVMAVVQNHLDGDTVPVGVYSHRAQKSILAVSQRLLQQEPYNPEEIYKNGIPRLDGADIPSAFVEYLNEAQSYARRLRAEEPDLIARQAVQNPRAVVITTEIKPIGIRYPRTFGSPNKAFILTAPRDVIPETTPDHFDDILNQAEYPLGHAWANRANGGNFSDTRTVIIETGRMGFSEDLAGELVERHGISNRWLRTEDGQRRQIIIFETKAGEIQKGKVFASFQS